MPLTVREFFKNERHLHLQFVAGDGGLHRQIRSAEVIRPAVALALNLWNLSYRDLSGHRGKRSKPSRPAVVGRGPEIEFPLESIQSGVWVIGSIELAALRAAPAPVRSGFLDLFNKLQPAAAIFTDGLSPAKLDPSLIRQSAIPIFTTRVPYTRFLAAFYTFLENRLAPHTDVHGTFMSIFGLGVLLLGPSGVGKSEIALSLIERSHRLVADDIVQIRLEQDHELIGSAPELGRHHMEIRGLGILNVRQIFGVSAVVDEHPIHLVVDLLPPTAQRRREERLGRVKIKRILGVEVPQVKVQVRTGRHMSVIVEAAARNQQLRSVGYDSAWAFRKTLAQRLAVSPAS